MSEYGSTWRRGATAEEDPASSPERRPADSNGDRSADRTATDRPAGNPPSSASAQSVSSAPVSSRPTSDAARDTATARDWREAWRAARDSPATPLPPDAPPAAGPAGRSATDAPASPVTGAAASDSAEPDAPPGAPRRGGFRAALHEGLTKARAMRAASGGGSPASGAPAAVDGRSGAAVAVVAIPDARVGPGSDVGPSAPATAPVSTGRSDPAALSVTAPTAGPAPAGATGLAAASATDTAVTAVVAPPGGLAPAVRSGPPTGVRPPVPSRVTRPPRAARNAGIRRAHLRLARIDPWTVMKVSFMLAIAFGIMTVVSVFVLWSMLDAAGVFESVAESVTSVTGDGASGGFDLLEWVALDRVLGVATLIAVVDVVLITALATLFAFLYNLASTLLGGIEVTLVEDRR